MKYTSVDKFLRGLLFSLQLLRCVILPLGLA